MGVLGSVEKWKKKHISLLDYNNKKKTETVSFSTWAVFNTGVWNYFYKWFCFESLTKTFTSNFTHQIPYDSTSFLWNIYLIMVHITFKGTFTLWRHVYLFIVHLPYDNTFNFKLHIFLLITHRLPQNCSFTLLGCIY